MKKQQWAKKLWMCGQFRSIKLAVLKWAPRKKSKASIGCEVIMQSSRPAPKSSVQKNSLLTRVAGTAIRKGQIKPTKVHGEKPWTFAVFKCKSMTSSGTGGFGRREAQRSEFIRPLVGAVLIRGPWPWIGLFYGSREWATYFRMPPCLKNATSMSFSKRAVTLKLFPVLVWKQRQTWALDVAWTKICMCKQIAV